ncbi:MAG: shikimate dehydrogenase [Gammaproteobacteria bacterium]|jgi:shikimate dehydrogenase|nr:shikimate dehydrogenase [Gammaproteobacteria bacterium]MBT5202803.1 shikimate dehydrogenase [Gammaproteobacteria bacterium]MBT5603099.1 shikimate dehydrogenase [Gammaproteobacteria bacterium]MBT6246865.1 shikimate dehydrogenase [Gammaproteobacteria bacterium]
MTLLAVFGNPIDHSRSPAIHEAFAEQFGIDLRYEKILVQPGLFNEAVQDFCDRGGTGFNITVPCKLDAFNLVDLHDRTAQTTGVVNTVSLTETGELTGYNTDGPGLVRDLKTHLNWRLEDRKILVLGAGGAVQGIMASLLSEAPSELAIWNRSAHKAIDIAGLFSDSRVTAKVDSEFTSSYDLVINGTSAGLSGSVPLVPRRVLGPETHCYDMVYGSDKTHFLKWCCLDQARPCADGLGMLIEQAALAFSIWFGREPDTHQVFTQLSHGSD